MKQIPFRRIDDKRLAAGLILQVKSQNPVLLQMIELDLWENLNVGLLVMGARPEYTQEEFYQIVCETGHAAAVLCATELLDQVRFMETFDTACSRMEGILEKSQAYEHGLDRERTKAIIKGLREILLDFISPDYINPMKAKIALVKQAA